MLPYLYLDLYVYLNAVKLDVEMEVVVENYEFKEELKNKSSPVYKETARNFTNEVKHDDFLVLLVFPSDIAV